MSTKNLKKVAVDAEAERYWTEYYADSGYGKQWVRSIPKRVQAELAKAEMSRSATKTASSPQVSLRPIATVITDTGVNLEGLASIGAGDERQVKAFVVEFDHDGNIQSFDSMVVR